MSGLRKVLDQLPASCRTSGGMGVEKTCLGVGQAVEEGPHQVQLAGPCHQTVPEPRVPPGKVPQHAIQVPQIPQPVVKFPLVEQVGGAVDHHILPGQGEDTWLYLHQILKEQVCIDIGRRGRWQNSVVQIEGRTPFPVGQRRDLVHPLAIVAFVVAIDVTAFPAELVERLLHLIDSVLGYDDIDIGNQPPATDRQTRHQVGAAL